MTARTKIESSVGPYAAYRGAWSGAVDYLIGELAVSAGVAYLCVLAHTNHVPPNATYWLALGGSSGSAVDSDQNILATQIFGA